METMVTKNIVIIIEQSADCCAVTRNGATEPVLNYA